MIPAVALMGSMVAAASLAILRPSVPEITIFNPSTSKNVKIAETILPQYEVKPNLPTSDSNSSEQNSQSKMTNGESNNLQQKRQIQRQTNKNHLPNPKKLQKALRKRKRVEEEIMPTPNSSFVSIPNKKRRIEAPEQDFRAICGNPPSKFLRIVKYLEQQAIVDAETKLKQKIEEEKKKKQQEEIEKKKIEEEKKQKEEERKELLKNQQKELKKAQKAKEKEHKQRIKMQEQSKKEQMKRRKEEQRRKDEEETKKREEILKSTVKKHEDKIRELEKKIEESVRASSKHSVSHHSETEQKPAETNFQSPSSLDQKSSQISDAAAFSFGAPPATPATTAAEQPQTEEPRDQPKTTQETQFDFGSITSGAGSMSSSLGGGSILSEDTFNMPANLPAPAKLEPTASPNPNAFSFGGLAPSGPSSGFNFGATNTQSNGPVAAEKNPFGFAFSNPSTSLSSMSSSVPQQDNSNPFNFPYPSSSASQGLMNFGAPQQQQQQQLQPQMQMGQFGSSIDDKADPQSLSKRKILTRKKAK